MVAIVSTLYPPRSTSGAAHGGVADALANLDSEDTHKLRSYVTVKGSDLLGDQDAIEMMCNDAPHVIREMEHLGCVFSRDEKGRVAQRDFGGHSKPRSCSSGVSNV